MLGWHKW